MDGILIEVANFPMYLIQDGSNWYDSRDVIQTESRKRRLEGEMCIHNFDGTDPIWVFNSLKQFHTSCSDSGIHEAPPGFVVPCFLTSARHDNLNHLRFL